MSIPHPFCEEYGYWCEQHACPSCDGVGEDYFEDAWNESTQSYGMAWTCRLCDGSGIDPAAAESQHDYEDDLD